MEKPHDAKKDYYKPVVYWSVMQTCTVNPEMLTSINFSVLTNMPLLTSINFGVLKLITQQSTIHVYVYNVQGSVQIHVHVSNIF